MTTINHNERIADPSCLVIKASDTPGSLMIIALAPTPLKNVGSVKRAMTAKIIRLTRLTSSFFPTKDARNMARPMIEPMIGK